MTHAHARFWARLSHLEDLARKVDALPDHIERLAATFDETDPVYAQFCREAHDPCFIRTRLARIRFKAENLSLDDAVEDLERLQVAANHVEFMALQRDLKLGRKQNNTLDNSRDKANQEKKDAASRRRKIVSDIAGSTGLTAGALERFVEKKLRDKHSIRVSIRTIRRDLDAVKKVGQTG